MIKKISLRDAMIVILVVLFAGVYYFTRDKDSIPNTEDLSVITNTTNTTMTTEGLTIETIREGSGASAMNGQVVLVDYTGSLPDGTIFDSSIPRGKPFMVHLGAGEVIRGWDLGLLGMKVGEERKLTIAPELGYGVNGFPGVIPPNATLIFDITLKAIQS